MKHKAWSQSSLDKRWWLRNYAIAWEKFGLEEINRGTFTPRTARMIRQRKASHRIDPIIHKGGKP